MDARDRLETVGGVCAMVAIMALSTFAFLFLVKGFLWLARNVLPWVVALGWVVLVADLAQFLPMALSRRMRPISAALIYGSSFIYGTGLWLFGFASTYVLWGGFAVVVGLLMGGVGIVPMAFIAGLFGGRSDVVVSVAAMAAFTFGSRLLAFKLDPDVA